MKRERRTGNPSCERDDEGRMEKMKKVNNEYGEKDRGGRRTSSSA